MAGAVSYPESLVFGLDIGTRSIVGTVGYKNGDCFYVVAQAVKEHETRAMLDGQIHDIGKVSGTIKEVKAILEEKTKRKLKDVCIAAAGRVLKTEYAHVEQEFEAETMITDEHIYDLHAAGVEKAYSSFISNYGEEDKFYCVGHSVIRYFMNGNIISNLESHKAKQIGMDMIATFLPSEVVDGLYTAVEHAGLTVANLTLEPIAAIEVAIPEKFRMLNIALVDVGAGTSDICITKDGSIASYGMIPTAGDGLTEIISQHCLVEFNVAEDIKRAISESDIAEYEDIMGLPQTITKEEVLALLEPAVDKMTTQVADCIMSLNGDKPVSAVFVVGGGGKIEGYTNKLAEKIGIQVQRVALRGEDVMQKIVFMDDSVKKDSLLVTPLGICLNFYEQNNNFIYVFFNEERMKLYDNGKLSIVDVVMQAGIPNEAMFPRRGESLNFTMNGKTRTVRGEQGEAAEFYLNGEIADLHTPIRANDVVRFVESTAGAPATMELSKLTEAKESIVVEVNGTPVEFPKFAAVNGELQIGSYQVQEGDNVELLNYYTVEQIVEFMDITIADTQCVYVNNKKADSQTKVYENFTFTIEEKSSLKNYREEEDDYEDESEEYDSEDYVAEDDVEEMADAEVENSIVKADNADVIQTTDTTASEGQASEATVSIRNIGVIVNHSPVILKGKSSYVFVEVFDYIDFDLTKSNGRSIVTNLNGRPAEYMEELHEGDVIEIYWKEV